MSPVENATVRPSALAGAWYPDDAAVLRRTIAGYLAQVQPALLPGKPLALVSPHAGYAYSGPTAAHAYAQIQGHTYTRVLLMGPLHRPIRGSRLGAFMTPAEAAYRTPLGDVPVDRAFLTALGRRVALTEVRRDQEHALEIELPFLQVVLDSPPPGVRPGFTLAPIMVGAYIADPGVMAHIEQLASAIAALCADGETLLVASTDLSHLDNYADVVRVDRKLVDLVAAFDVDGLAAALQAEQVQACGAVGLVTVLRAAQKLGARGAQVLAHTSSGDVTGNKRPGTYTVGYLAAAVYA